ncbi:acyl carrier protein [Eubacterium sp. AB3007]|jgi:acyl carrier protein|uniref:acyl carrier protein n=1 Tax=Eubacterium sp. AB3007 TaxID=1392487 RepID=UPI0004890BB2|nr:acyl carrier protein [Eubacterium sp. AB3007]
MLFEQVKETMVETLNCDEEKIVPEASIADDLNIDSLDAVELVMALEEKLGVRIPDQELENLKQVKDIVACIEKYRG